VAPVLTYPLSSGEPNKTPASCVCVDRVYERMDSYENGEQDDELPRSKALVVLDILELSLFMELCRDLRDDESESEFARLTAERLYSDSVEVLKST